MTHILGLLVTDLGSKWLLCRSMRKSGLFVATDVALIISLRALEYKDEREESDTDSVLVTQVK